MEGIVKKLVEDRGFGFIKGEDGREVFFHRSGVIPNKNDFDHLREGDRVEYEMEQSNKGPRAVNVERV